MPPKPRDRRSSCHPPVPQAGQQGRVENSFFRYKAVIGSRVRARTIASQKAEATDACNVLNRMRTLGWPTSERATG